MRQKNMLILQNEYYFFKTHCVCSNFLSRKMSIHSVAISSSRKTFCSKGKGSPYNRLLRPLGRVEV